MRYLEVPQTDVKIDDNSKVIYNDKLYLLSYDYYIEDDELKQGWLLKSEQHDSNIVVTDDMLMNIRPVTHVANDCDDRKQCCLCNISMCSIDDTIYQADRAFITVNSIVDRDTLNHKLLIDGKMVRVNNVLNEDTNEFEAKYYTWNATEETWAETHIEFSPDDYVDKEYLENNFAKISDVNWTKIIGDDENG